MMPHCSSSSEGYPMTADVSGVVAGCEIPTGARVGPLKGPVYVGQFPTERPDVRQPVKVVCTSGELSSLDISGTKWTTFIQAARDRYEQNAEVYKTTDGYVYIRTIREIRQDECIYLWYEDSLAIENNIPFLSLTNIKGSQAYECSDCGQTYRYPNPLKAHMRFTCRKMERETDIKMEPLHSQIEFVDKHNKVPFSARRSSAFSQQDFSPDMEVRCAAKSYRQSNGSAFDIYGASSVAMDLQVSRNNSYQNQEDLKDAHNFRKCHSSHRHIHPRLGPMECQYGCHMTCGVTNSSCFSPYKLKASISVSSDLGCAVSLEQNPLNYSSQCQWDTNRQKCPPRYDQKLSAFPLPSEADGEPIDVLHRSFLALSSKKGHLCIYCGKFYSRKYGLKIHLRTHTGYKPLKCKVCFRAFGDPSNLNKHIRLHAEGDTPYKCEYCGKVLVRRRDLTRHIKSRHPDVVEAGIDEHSDETDC